MYISDVSQDTPKITPNHLQDISQDNLKKVSKMRPQDSFIDLRPTLKHHLISWLLLEKGLIISRNNQWNVYNNLVSIGIMTLSFVSIFMVDLSWSWAIWIMNTGGYDVMNRIQLQKLGFYFNVLQGSKHLLVTGNFYVFIVPLLAAIWNSNGKVNVRIACTYEKCYLKYFGNPLFPVIVYVNQSDIM